jgi:hypothetical protein
MKKYILACGLLILVFVSLAAIAYADPPTPHDPPHGKPTTVPTLSSQVGAVQALKRHGIFGTIKGLGANTFTVSTKQGDVVVTWTDSTKFRIPTKKSGSSGDLAEGDRVAVNGMPNNTGGLDAKQVVVAPGKPDIQHRVGTVKSYDEGKSITINDVQGGTEEFTLTTDTVIRGPNGNTVKVGDRVTIVSRRDPSARDFTATAIVVHPQK